MDSACTLYMSYSLTDLAQKVVCRTYRHHKSRRGEQGISGTILICVCIRKTQLLEIYSILSKSLTT